MVVTNDIKHIGVNDRKTDLFEGQYKIPNGIAYNSYVIIDEKIAVMDTVDAAFSDEWMQNLKSAIGDKAPDYLVVHHMEPDHSASIMKFAVEYPDTKIVATAKAFSMIKGFFGVDFPERQIIVKDADKLTLGRHELTFITAPMVHWPEVMLSYDSTDKILFSADAFGKFGATDAEEPWIDEARRYYIGIVGKYGNQVQALLKKAAALDIKIICSLHGPVLKENISYYVNLYDIWSSYRPEDEGVVIAYTSVYGNTKRAADILFNKLSENGTKSVIYDLARCDMPEAVASAFKYDKLVLATTTYNGDVFPFMREYINHLTERGFCNRKVAFIENGSWAPVAAKVMKGMLEGSKNIAFAESTVKITSALDADSNAQIDALVSELSE